jgi:hypothetical protein
MSATQHTSLALCLRLLAVGALACLAPGACAPVPGDPPYAESVQDCGPSSACQEELGLSEQVRLDTEAMLAGIAHARARLGLQEGATP